MKTVSLETVFLLCQLAKKEARCDEKSALYAPTCSHILRARFCRAAVPTPVSTDLDLQQETSNSSDYWGTGGPQIEIDKETATQWDVKAFINSTEASEHGSLYYSDNATILHVNILERNLALLDQLPLERDDLKYHVVKNSYKELCDLQDAMWEHQKELGLVESYPDVISNRTAFLLLNDTPETRAKIAEMFPDTHLYEFIEVKRRWDVDPVLSRYADIPPLKDIELTLKATHYATGDVKMDIRVENHSRDESFYLQSDLWRVEILHEEKWYELPMINGFSQWLQETVQPGDEKTLTEDPEQCYGYLNPGHYRLICVEIDHPDEQYAYVEFDVLGEGWID